MLDISGDLIADAEEVARGRQLLRLARDVLDLFVGRDDVYYARSMRDGSKRYHPQCGNFWREGRCRFRTKDSSSGGAGLCGDCPHQDYLKVSEITVLRHLRGDIAVGIVTPDFEGRSKLVMADFDGHGVECNGLADSRIVRCVRFAEGAARYGARLTAEKSQSGTGGHAWQLAEPTEASRLRTMMRGLLAVSGIPEWRRIEIFPKSDQPSRVGTAIALPLQGQDVRNWRTVFVDEDFGTIWPPRRALQRLRERRMTAAQVEETIARLEAAGAYAGERLGSRGSRPRPRRASRDTLARAASDVPADAEYELVEDPVAAIFESCAAFGRIRDTAEDKLPPTGRHGLGHADRLALASVLRGLPGGPEEIHRLVGMCGDYIQRLTDRHITSMKKPPMRCETLIRDGVCDGTCDAIRKRGGVSPVAFAYFSGRVDVHLKDQSPLTADPDLLRRFLERFGDCQ